MSNVDWDFRQAPPSAVFQRNQSSDVGNLTRRLRSFSHLSEAVRTANRPHVIWQSSVRRVSTPRDLCNVCGRQGSRIRPCITAPFIYIRVNVNDKEEKKKNPDLFLMPCFPLEAPPTLDMCRTVNRPRQRPHNTRTAWHSDAYTCTSHPLMIAIPCVLKPR